MKIAVEKRQTWAMATLQDPDPLQMSLCREQGAVYSQKGAAPTRKCALHNRLCATAEQAAKNMLRVMALGGIVLMVALLTSCARPSASQGRALYSGKWMRQLSRARTVPGTAPLAPNLPARPIDFRDVSLFKRGATESYAIAETLERGVSADHPVPALHYTHHELLMPRFDHLTKTERRSIALYVISLREGGDFGSVKP